MAYNTQPTTTGKKNPMETKAEGAKPKPSPQKKEWTKKSPKSKIDWTNTYVRPEPKSNKTKLQQHKQTLKDKKSTRHDAPVKRETMTRTVTQKTGPGVRITKPSPPSTPTSGVAKPVKKPTGGKKRIQQQENLKR